MRIVPEIDNRSLHDSLSHSGTIRRDLVAGPPAVFFTPPPGDRNGKVLDPK